MEQRERLGNQQGRLEMDELSYLGGLVTGEGCFCFSVQRVKARKGKLKITPIFALFMSDKETIYHTVDLLKKVGLPVYIQERPKAGRDQLGISVGGHQRVGRYCDTLLPYLTGQKARAAQIVQDFIVSRKDNPPQSPYTEYELDLVRELREVNGNTRGKKNPL
jgi:hypothetical protein